MSERVSTGLCDSNGKEVFVGDKLKKDVTCNNDMHGDWAIYEVKQQGLTPIISYVESEKGKLLPEGYLAAPLCGEYDRKMFCFTRDTLILRPCEDFYIIEKGASEI